MADAAGRARHHSHLPASKPAAVEQRLPGGEAGHRYRRRLLVAKALWFLRDRHGRCGRILGVPAARREAEYLVALGEPCGARRLDRARDVDAEDPRERRLPVPPPALPVGRVHGRSVDPDQQLPLAGLRTIGLLVAEDVGVARLMNHHGLHLRPPLTRRSRAACSAGEVASRGADRDAGERGGFPPRSASAF